MTSFSKRDLTKALEKLLPSLDPSAVTFSAVMEDLAEHLGVDKRELKTNHKEELKQLIPDLLHLCQGGDNKENENNQDPEDDDEPTEVTRKKRPLNQIAPSRSRVIEDSDEEDDGESDTSAPKRMSSGSEEDDEEDASDDSDEPTPKRRRQSSTSSRPSKTKSSKQSQAKPKATRKVADKPKDPEGIAALKEIARVSGLLGPAVYAQLKRADSEDEQESILRDRLEDAGVTFSGRYPKKSEILAAKRKRDQAKELDGIDTSLIISSGRPRRGAQTSYVSAFTIERDDDDEEEEDHLIHQLDDREPSEDDAKDEAASDESDESEAEF